MTNEINRQVVERDKSHSQGVKAHHEIRGKWRQQSALSKCMSYHISSEHFEMKADLFLLFNEVKVGE